LLADDFRSQGSSIFQWFRSALHLAPPLPPERKAEPYMDDIILPSHDNDLTCLTEKAKIVPTREAVQDVIDDVPPGFGVDSSSDIADSSNDINDAFVHAV
jgi:hypothetical protein